MTNPINENEPDERPDVEDNEINPGEIGEDDPFLKHRELHRSGGTGT